MTPSAPPDPLALAALLDGLGRMPRIPAAALMGSGTTVVGLETLAGFDPTATLSIDEPDPYIELLIDDTGQPVAYGSWIPWSSVPAFVDIGVVTVPSGRRTGAGRSVVASVARSAGVRGLHPLYRCDIANEGSRRLAESAGFTSVYELSAWEFDSR